VIDRIAPRPSIVIASPSRSIEGCGSPSAPSPRRPGSSPPRWPPRRRPASAPIRPRRITGSSSLELARNGPLTSARACAAPGWRSRAPRANYSAIPRYNNAKSLPTRSRPRTTRPPLRHAANPTSPPASPATLVRKPQMSMLRVSAHAALRAQGVASTPLEVAML
jgi:hypothetical protein